jgi:hypothetical protein
MLSVHKKIIHAQHTLNDLKHTINICLKGLSHERIWLLMACVVSSRPKRGRGQFLKYF